MYFKDIVVFTAAGNSGGSGFSTCTIESQLKNIISVGSTESTLDSSNLNYVSWFSSRGPSFDDR